MMIEKQSKGEKSNTISNMDGELLKLTSKWKSMMSKALGLYDDALEPLKFKYDHLCDSDINNDSGSGDNKHSMTTVVFHKIAKLYTKKGSHAAAVDAYRRALEAYGITGVDRSQVTKKKSDFHPDAAFVQHDLTQLHLSNKEYNDAVYAAEKSIELAHQFLKSSAKNNNERIEMMTVLAYQIADDAYGRLNRYEDVTRSYQEAYYDFEKIVSSSQQ